MAAGALHPTHSLLRKPGMAVLPPISPMFAQNMPCRSSGRSAMLAATVALSPACSRPGTSNHRERRFRHGNRVEVIFADVGRTEEYLWDRKPLIVHRQGLVTFAERLARDTDSSWSVSGVVRKYILLNYRVPGWARAASPGSKDTGIRRKRGTWLDSHPGHEWWITFERRTGKSLGPSRNPLTHNSTPP